MLQSKLFYKTTREKSVETESVSHDLLIRAGFVDQLMAGVYTFLPLGFKVIKNVENIIRKNMPLYLLRQGMDRNFYSSHTTRHLPGRLLTAFAGK